MAGQWLSDTGHSEDGGIPGQDFWDGLRTRDSRKAERVSVVTSG